VSAVLIGRFEAGSPEWHAARRNGVGGSEVAPILGLSPWASRFSLWYAKAGLAETAFEMTPEVEWGNRLEAAVLTKFQDEHPDLYVDTDAGTFHHPDRPWQIANPDGLAYGPGPGIDSIVEAKTARWADGWGDPGTDEIPVYYRTQVLWYLDTFEVQRAHVAVLIGGSDYREYVVEHDPDEAAYLRAEVRRFLDSIEAGERPSIDEHTATYLVLRELHPEIDDMTVEVSADLAVKWISARDRAARAKDDEQLAKSLLAEAMGTAKKAVWRDLPLATRQARSGGTPYVVAARKLPTVAEALAGLDTFPEETTAA
jgi:putative phage-type endonuclease